MVEEANLELINQSVSAVNRILSLKDASGLGNRPILVNICGASASGKSTIADLLSGSLPDCTIFPMDSYLAVGLWDQNRVFNHDSPNPDRPYIAGISPEVYDMDLMRNHFAIIKQGGAIEMPIFDEVVKDRVGYTPFSRGRIMVVDGIYSFEHPFIDSSDLKILVLAPLHDRLTRKMVRTQAVFGRRDEVNEVIDRYLTRDEPANRFYEPEYVDLASLVIDNLANPVSDYGRMQFGLDQLEEGREIKMLPKEDTGKSHSEEGLSIIIMLNGKIDIQYKVGNRVLVQAPVQQQTVDLLGEYYIYD